MNRLAMLYLAHALDRAGFLPVSLSYRSMRGMLDEHVAAIARRMASIPADTVHLVGHSMGGVVALSYLQREPDRRIGRVVLLGSPVAGSQAAHALARRQGGRLLLGRSIAMLQSHHHQRLDGPFCVGAIAGSRPLGLARFVVRLPAPNDGMVTVDETKLPGLTDHIVLPVSHGGMLISSRVARQVAAFLRRGHFDP
jgi:pimeloyl-ACP methyl ester carboxylesterase